MNGVKRKNSVSLKSAFSDILTHVSVYMKFLSGVPFLPFLSSHPRERVYVLIYLRESLVPNRTEF